MAAADADDHDHNRCVATFRTARRPWLVPQPVIAEVCYLLEHERGSQVEAAFFRSFGRVLGGRQLSGSVHPRCCSGCCFGAPIWIGS